MGEDVKTNVVKRDVTRVLSTPYLAGEEERDILVEEIISEREKINELEKEIDPLKEKLKEHQKDLEKFIKNLVKGKTETIEVEEILDFEAGKIKVVRKDNGEHVETREMTDEDYQTQTTDEPVETEVGPEETEPETAETEKTVE